MRFVNFCKMTENTFRLPTLDEFLQKPWPQSAYIQYEGFNRLYIRKNDRVVEINGQKHKCHNVITLANIEANVKGQGALTRLLQDLVSRGFAVYIECVQNPKFEASLDKKQGFIRLTGDNENCYLYNFANHLS